MNDQAAKTKRVSLLIALQPDDHVVLQISEGDKALAFITLDRNSALDVSEKIKKLAERIPAKVEK